MDEPAHHTMSSIRRSFSLLELIIAIALVIGMGAMLVPAMLRSMQERAFETARDVTDDELSMARAHSQETGEAVEVVYRANPPRVETRVLNEAAGTEDSEILGPVGAWDGRTGAAGFTNVSGGRSASHRSVELGSGFSMTASAPVKLPLSASWPAAGENGESSVGGIGHVADSDDVRLAVFMPDGSAVAGQPIWLRDDDGRMCRLTINPWTGVATFERVYDAEDAEPWAGEDEDVLNHLAPDEFDSERTSDRSRESSTRPAGPAMSEASDDKPSASDDSDSKDSDAGAEAYENEDDEAAEVDTTQPK